MALLQNGPLTALFSTTSSIVHAAWLLKTIQEEQLVQEGREAHLSSPGTSERGFEQTNTHVAKVSGTAILYAISTAAPDLHGAVRISS